MNRALIKTITYRIIGTLITIMTALIVTGRVNWSITIGVIELVLKPVAYYFHEKLWEVKIK